MRLADQLNAAKAKGSNFSVQLKAAKAPTNAQRFAELGSLGAFLEAVEMDLKKNLASVKGTQLLAAKRREAFERRASELRSWAEQHEHEHEREHGNGPSIATIISAWKDFQVECWEGDPPVTTAATVFGVEGERIYDVEDLSDFASEFDGGVIRRDEADERTQALRYHNEKSGAAPIRELERYVDGPRHWLVAFDRQSIAPVGIAGAALEAWAIEWRESIPALRGSELAVYVTGGKCVAFVTWWEHPKDASQAREWCRSISSDPDDPRFESLDTLWCVPGPAVYLPSAYESSRPRTLRDLSRTDCNTSSSVSLDTGIPSLTKQFRGRGLPIGARVVIGGLTGQGKTTLALHFAEVACEQQWFVLWLAFDESVGEVQARRLQRRGVAPGAAQGLPEHELAKLDPLPFIVLGPGEPFEDLFELAHVEAEDRPVLVVIDSIQKLETRAGRGKGERERITACIDAIQAAQAKHPAVVVMTAEIARGSGATKGSGSIDYGATLALRVHRSGTQLRVEIPKSRHGTEDGFTLELDSARQRLEDPVAAKAAQAQVEAHTDMWLQVQAVLSERGPKSRKALELYIKGKSDLLRAVLAERLEAGDLTHEGAKYSLPGAGAV